MHRRHQDLNIPTELLRTLTVVAETGSFTRAAEKLLLSQPAISGQVKRLQSLVGGSLFRKADSSVALNERGAFVLEHARQMLEANDRILALTGVPSDPQPLRLGIASFLCEDFWALWSRSTTARPCHVQCQNAEDVDKALSDGFVDIACLTHPSEAGHDVVLRWDEDIVWARRRDFLLSPGAPIPLVAWPASAIDRAAMRALERHGTTYRLDVTAPDQATRIAAVVAGVGVMPLPARCLPTSLIAARDYYLPALPPAPAALSLRDGVDLRRTRATADLLRALAPAKGSQALPSAVEHA